MSTEPEPIWTIRKVLAAAKDFLEKHGSGSPRLEAERLMAFALGVERIELYVQFDRPLTGTERGDYKRLIATRAEGTPLQYITGEQGFRRLVLKVTPDVLIPRPETEILVDVVLDNLKLKFGEQTAIPGPEILDIGAGSGAIAISVAVEFPASSLWALDISSDALSVARENAAKYGALESISFFESDLFDKVADRHPEPFDVVVANPPYIASEDMVSLPPEVLREPTTALDGGPGGFDFLRRISAGAGDYLKKGAFLAMEIGADQAGGVSDILQRDGYTDISVFKDYAKRDRVILGRWNR